MERQDHIKSAEVSPQAAKSRLRKDLLSPAEAREEYRRRLTNVLPDLPAFVVVVNGWGRGRAGPFLAPRYW